MARIFVSTNKKDVNEVIKLNQDAGFSNYLRYDAEYFSLVVFKKKIHPVENFYHNSNGDFVALVGTGFYNGVTGERALKSILSDFDGDIIKLQENIVGNYLLAIYKDDMLNLITDKYQVIKTYYTEYEKGWAVSNNLSDLIEVGSYLTKESIDYFGLLSETFLVSSFSKNTIVKNIKRLFGFEFLHITNNKLSIKHIGHKKNHYDLSGLSKVEIAENYANKIKKYIEIIIKNFDDSIGIHQTGGLDNRTILAAFLNANVKPEMLYGIGNSCLTNTKKQDLDSVKLFEKDLGLKLKLMDWSHDKNTIKNQDWEKSFNNYGFLYSIYSGSYSFFDSYEKEHDDYPKFMECGYFLENLRLREFAYNIDTMTVENFVDEYLVGGAYGKIRKNTVSNYDEYRDHLIKELGLQIEIYGIDLTNGINKDNFDEVRWIHARHTDTIMVNFLNLYTSSFSIFSQPDVHEYPFCVPSDFRADASFQLMVINALYKKLLTFPFFSHGKYQYFDSEKVVLKPILSTSTQLKTGAKNFVKGKLGKATINFLSDLYRALRKQNLNVDPNSFEQVISVAISKVLSESLFYEEITFDLDSIDLRYPMRLVFSLKAIDYLNSKKTNNIT